MSFYDLRKILIVRARPKHLLFERNRELIRQVQSRLLDSPSTKLGIRSKNKKLQAGFVVPSLPLLILLALLAAIPLTVIVSQQQQEIRQRAAVLIPSPAPTCGTYNNYTACTANGCIWEVVPDFGGYCISPPTPTQTPAPTPTPKCNFSTCSTCITGATCGWGKPVEDSLPGCYEGTSACPFGFDSWYWSSCSSNVCASSPTSTPAPTPTQTPAPTSTPAPACRAEDKDGKGWDETCTNTGGSSIKDECVTTTSYRYAVCVSTGCGFGSPIPCPAGKSCRLKDTGQPECFTPATPTPTRTSTPTPTSPPSIVVTTAPTSVPRPTSIPTQCTSAGGGCGGGLPPCCSGVCDPITFQCPLPSPTSTLPPTSTPGQISIPLCPTKSQGDLNNDCKINIADYNIWKNAYLTKNIAAGDVNDDGEVDLVDFNRWRDNARF